MPPASAAARCLVLLLSAAALHTAHAQSSASFKELSELAERGDIERAAQQAEAYVQAHPKDPRGRFLRAVILARQNRVDEAIAAYRALTDDYPELPEPYNNLAALYASQGRYEAAREALERAVRAKPGFATAHENLGDIYARLAAQSYAKALELDGGRESAREKLKTVNELVPTAPPAGSSKP